MEGAIQLAALLLALLSIPAIIGNWVLLIDAQLFHRNHSLVPLVGGVAGAIALAICPFDSLRPLWWTPLVFDPGCALLLVACLIAVLVWGIKRARDR